MPFTCIPKPQADAFKKALKDKDIQIADLLQMDTAARTKVFESFAGDQAKAMNQLFEEKLVLKNKALGLKNFISKVAQEGRYDPAKKAALDKMASEYRAQQQERIFNPSEEQGFLNDLADTALGSHVTRAEARNVFDLSQKVDEAKKEFDGKEWSSSEAQRTFGDAEFVYNTYTDALKEGPVKLKELVKEAYASYKERFKTDPPNAIRDLLAKTTNAATDASVAIVASIDDSFVLRQGIRTLFTEPKRFIQAKMKGIPYKNIWWNATHNSFTDFYKTLRGFDQKAVLMSDYYSRPNRINGAYEDAHIGPKQGSEQYPTSLPERIPGVGGVFRASQAAFEGAALRMRMDTYDFASKVLEKNGVDMEDSYQRKSLGEVINVLTSKTSSGRPANAATRLLLWAPKMILSDIDTLTLHARTDISPAARLEAATNLVSSIAVVATVMTIMNAVKPGSAETDPRSSDFGKFRWVDSKGIKHTIGFAGSAPSLVVLATRLALGIANTLGSPLPAVKSSTGIYKKINTNQYGTQTAMEVLFDFLEGKTPPATGVLVDLMRGTDYKGQPLNPATEVTKPIAPITIQNLFDINKDPTASQLLGIIGDVFGGSHTTYLPNQDSWTQKPGVELQAFKAKVGAAKFKAANDLFDNQTSSFITSLADNPKYQVLSDIQKQAVITKKKEDLKAAIMKSNGFVYKRAKPVPTPKI